MRKILLSLRDMENFIVSARKYRPATFATVVGQNHITSTLKNAIERGQLAHAYLFCGPRGVGKTTCARIFAKAINCMNSHGAEACNECESCVSFNSGSSLNIHELDAASNNSVEDIRSLIEQVRIIPQVGKNSLCIIDEVHMLSTAAFNAFLKTLEEPPAHAIFILATTEKHKILPTILSRCQIYDFRRIKVEDTVEYLRHIAQSEGVTTDDESLNLIAQKADGGMRDALSMFDKAVSFGGRELNFKKVAQTLNVLDYDTFFELTDRLLEGNYVEALLSFDRVLEQGFGAQNFMVGLNRHFRDLLVAKNPSSIHLLELTGSLQQRYSDQALRCDVGLLFGAISVLTDIDSKIRQSSAQRLLVELGLMKIAGLGQKKNGVEGSYTDVATPLPDLVQRAPAAKAAVEVPTQPKVEIAEPKAEVVMPAQPKVVSKRPSILNLGELLSGESKVTKEEPQTQRVERVSAPQVEVESAAVAAQSLESAREEIMKHLAQWRPRFIAVFEMMRIEGNTINIAVPTQELKEEIMRGETELLTRVVELSGVRSGVSLKIEVNEEVKSSKPIKLEDRIAYIMEQNPLIAELREALDLDIEG